MASVDIAPIVARMVAVIEALPAIGRVHDHEVWDRDDFAPLVTSTIEGVPVMRAWLVVGPTLTESSYMTQSQPANAILRRWSYQIMGLEGVDAQAATAFGTLRTNLVRVIDALDTDRQVGGSAHRSDPCMVVEAPQLRLIADRYLVAFVTATKVIDTLSSP